MVVVGNGTNILSKLTMFCRGQDHKLKMFSGCSVPFCSTKNLKVKKKLQSESSIMEDDMPPPLEDEDEIRC